MKIKKLKTKIHRVTMTREEMSFALFAFRRVHAHERFMAIRVRLSNTLGYMGVDTRGEEFDEDMELYEICFETVRDTFH